jgi:hypothetical protein
MSTFIFDWSNEKARFATSSMLNCFSSVGCFSADLRLSVFCTFLSSGDIAHLNAVFQNAVPWGITDSLYDISDFVTNTQTSLFMQIVSNSVHCLHHLLLERKDTCYSSRKREHEFQLLTVSTSLFKIFSTDYLCRHTIIDIFCLGLPVE